MLCCRKCAIAGAADESLIEGEHDDHFRFQVIDTIVEWIDDNLNQPLRIDDIARHAGYSQLTCSSTCSTKGSLGRYVRERLKLAARDLRDTDQVYDICLKYGFDSPASARAFYPHVQPAAGAYRKESMAVRIEMFNRPAKPAPPNKAK